MNNWVETTLSQVSEVKLCNVDKKTNKDEIEVRLCNYMDVYKNPFINSNKAKTFMIATCNKSELANFKIQEGQVAITKDSEKRDDIGISTYMAESFDDVVLGYHTALITPEKGTLSGKYLNYWFNTKFVKVYFENNAGGSGQRCTLPIDIIKSIPLKLPPINLQEKIASIFYNIDSKIELNNNINAELENMAKTIYDYWFVQFDFPDKNGKPYKSSGGKMEWNEELKREIPEGWIVNEIGNICKLYQPKTISEKDLIEDGKYIVFGANGEIGKYDQFNHEFSEIIVTCRGNSCGNISRTRPFSWITGNAMVVKSNSNSISTEYIYQTLLNTNITSVISGSAQPQITRTNLAPIPFLAPSEAILNNFNLIVEPMVRKRLNNIEENQQLASLRNWLLPMLMNGQVKVN